jgi:poly-beta-1,6 N-acetyl-D-glucosamine synthase
VQRLKRIVFALIVFAAAVALLGALFINLFGNLEVTNFFVDFSTFVLLLFLLILIARYALLIWFAYWQHIDHLSEPAEPEQFPKVTIIVPAYNEGPVIKAAVQSLMKLDYPDFEAVVVDDGSTDNTYEQAMFVARMVGPDSLRVIRQPNSGKAVALNTGIAHARGELVLCMDGDSRLEPQTLRQAAKHFSDPEVAAVAGHVKVANRLNTLTRLQALEYIEGLNLVRTAQAFFRMVTVIPGPVGMFRKSVLNELGGYMRDTYAEDCDLTLRIVLAGWKIKYESRAVAWTEAPETFQALFKQRYRWSRGILQAVIKHKRSLLRPYPQFVNWLFLWMLVFESVALPGMNVFGIVFFAAAAMWGGVSYLIFLWWAQLTILDIMAALFCCAVEKEDIKLSLYAIPYRLYFIPYVDVMRFFSTLDEIYGVRMGWGRLERFGRI